MNIESFENFGDLLEYRARNQGTRLAFRFLRDGERVATEWTYEELDCHARSIGQFLSEEGASSKRVLLLYPPGLEYIAALFGCFYAGAVAVPAYPPRNNRNLQRLFAIQQNCDASIVLTTEATLGQLQIHGDHEIMAHSKIYAHERLNGQKNWQRKRTENSPALLQYTSASTGAPKGVKITHRNLLHNSAILRKSFCYTQESACVSWLPTYHDMGLVGGVLQPIYGGFSCTLLSPVHFLQRPHRWLEAISRFGATISGGPNFAYDLCVRRQQGESIGELDLSKWSVAFNGSEPVSVETMRQFTDTFAPCGFRWESFFPCYGLAEATLIVAGGPCGSGPVIREINGEYTQRNNVELTHRPKPSVLSGSGQVPSGVEVCIVDPETLSPCGPNKLGEIWIRSGSCGEGYWEISKEADASFQAYLADSNEGPYLRSGDLGLLSENQLFITGRIKDLIIIRGTNHYPQDIENTVQQSHPAFVQHLGAAFSVETHDGEWLVVLQEFDRHQERCIGEALYKAQEKVTEEHGLQVYTIMAVRQGTIPKTTSGKVQRWAAKEAFINKKVSSVAHWQTNHLSGMSI